MQKLTFKKLKDLERKPLRHCEGDGKVTFTRPFLMLDKVTFDEQVNVQNIIVKRGGELAQW